MIGGVSFYKKYSLVLSHKSPHYPVPSFIFEGDAIANLNSALRVSHQEAYAGARSSSIASYTWWKIFLKFRIIR